MNQWLDIMRATTLKCVARSKLVCAAAAAARTDGSSEGRGAVRHSSLLATNDNNNHRPLRGVGSTERAPLNATTRTTRDYYLPERQRLRRDVDHPADGGARVVDRGGLADVVARGRQLRRQDGRERAERLDEHTP